MSDTLANIIATMQEIGERLRHVELREIVQPILGKNPLTVSVDTTLTAYDFVVFVDTTAGNVRITLPLGAPYGYQYHIKNIGVNTVIVDGNGSNVDAGLTFNIVTQWESHEFKANGTFWGIL